MRDEGSPGFISAIPCKMDDGVEVRSTLEARWFVFLQEVFHRKIQYEPERVSGYLFDFRIWMEGTPVIVEIKPNWQMARAEKSVDLILGALRETTKAGKGEVGILVTGLPADDHNVTVLSLRPLKQSGLRMFGGIEELYRTGLDFKGCFTCKTTRITEISNYRCPYCGSKQVDALSDFKKQISFGVPYRCSRPSSVKIPYLPQHLWQHDLERREKVRKQIESRKMKRLLLDESFDEGTF